jgi:Tc toxin complex TcA C-terminal TcB-binding domain/Neuraminidase-like domain/Salmonella virulence plasmid 28.1kDa A protein
MKTTSDSSADPKAIAATSEEVRSEWEVLVGAVNVHLEGMAPADLEPEHVVQLSAATGCEPATVARFAAAHRVAHEVDVSVEIVYALVHQGLPADTAALAACGEDAHRSAIEGAIAAGGVPVGVRDQADTSVEGLQRVAADQPVALTHPETLYATTAAAAAGRSKPAKIVSARLEACLHDEVRRAIGTVGPEVERALHTRIAGLKWQENADRPIAEVAEALLADVGREDPALAPETTAARNRMAAAPPTLVSDALHLHDPLNENPLLHDDLSRGKAVEHARLAGLGEEATRAVLERSAALADGEASALAPLVANGSLQADDAAALRRVLELAKLTGDNLPLMRVLDSRSETDPSALAAKTRKDWQDLLEEHDIPLPPGETTSTYADAITRNLESTFPTRALVARIGQGPVARFFANNAELDLRYVDFVHGSGDKLDWKGVTKKDRPVVRRELERMQRVLAIADGTEAQKQLLDRGYDSALKISRMREQEFMVESGLSNAQAKVTYARAQEAALSVAHGYGAIRDIIGQFGDLAVGNVSPQLVNDLRQIDGFSDLFGSQDFCSCSSCQSVLSPAAYFCDLMHFVDQNVSKPVFVTPKKTTHPLYLKTRRPDLWTLKLTCENTNTLVPYLTIVDEVLETFLSSIVGGDIYKTLADPSDKVSFRVPFSLTFAELDLYLSHFGLGPADIYEALQLGDSKVWRARLRLSPDEATVIVTADPTGVPARLGNPSTLDDFDVQDFLRLTGLTRGELDDVLALRSNTDLQGIVVAKKKKADELQNFAEILQKLTAARADFIHRYIRLKRATPWKIDELDLVLVALHDAGLIAGGIDDDVVQQLGQLVKLQSALRLNVEELCAIPGALPVSSAYPLQPTEDADLLLYERLFDLPKLFGLKNATTGELNQSTSYRHYSLDTINPTDTTIDPNTPLLLAGLGISETDLLLLFDLLKDELPFDDSGHCTLDRPKLSLLYRHVRLGRALRLSVEDLIRALALLFAPGAQVLTSLDQIRQLIDFRTWLRSSPFTTSELRFVLAGIESGTMKYANTLESVAQLVLQVQALAATGRVEILRAQLASLFNVAAERLTSTLEWITADITDAAIATALDTTFTDGVPDNPTDLEPLVELVRQLERVNTLFTNLKLGDETIAYLTANRAVLGIASLEALTLHDVRSLTFYRLLATLRDDVEPEVQDALAAYLAAGTVSPGDDRARLADLWQVDTSLIDSLVDVLPLPVSPVDALETIGAGLNLCSTLGVNGYSLQKLGDDSSYATLEAARNVALGSFAAKYEDETERETKLEPYQDRVNMLKRDALCDYVIARRPDLKFRDLSEIYDYFLLDVEMSGCFRTSRVVCATNSVQLYVQRCLLNLEQSDPKLNPSIPDIKVDPSRIPADEWEWRKNYRVWEANRKVFLFPESYIDPDLRDDKSPIFNDLSDNLLQKKITTDTAAEAYQRYVTQFAELSHLRICGSYYHSATGTYYFVGRTQQDPPVFYYRTWDGTTWAPWQKIELAITAPYVALEMHLGRLYIFWVEGKSKDKTSIQGGDSTLEYYEVKVNLSYSFLTPEGKWAAVQKLPWLYPSEDETGSAVAKIFDESDLTEMELSKTYLKVYPRAVGNKLVLRYYNRQLNSNYYFDRELDLFHNKLRGGSGIKDHSASNAVLLYETTNSAQLGIEKYDFKTDNYFDEALEEPTNLSTPHTYITDPFPYTSYGTTDPRRDYPIHYVENAYPESVFTLGDQQYLIHEKPLYYWLGGFIYDADVFAHSDDVIAHGSGPEAASGNGFALIDTNAAPSLTQMIVTPTPYASRELVRLSTSRADDLGEILVSDGLEDLFSLDTQLKTEKPLGITITDLAELAPPAEDKHHLDFNGAFGGYYRELFLHIPWLIAFHLNANQQFEDAMWWYQRIFDPTANESKLDIQETDRNWRYVEFRNLTMPTLKAILTDSAAIAAYKKDPFNPFAIARLRPSAFQKAIVMHFVSNLLDWGDSLFAQDTMESISEATMLYVLAAEILGKRPVTLGECETAPDDDLTYEKIGPAIDKGSEFLVTLENWCYVTTWQLGIQKANMAIQANALSKSAAASHQFMNDVIEAPLVSIRGSVTSPAVVEGSSVRQFNTVVKERARQITVDKAQKASPPTKVSPAPHVVNQCTLVFCVPQNEELLKYWDRVEDRLYKIRNCMNISGVRRSLALFAPPINPMALVRAKAAGLSLEEALAAMAAPVPPYRFSYLIERARQAAQTVQSFGASLLSALEKKDVEELTLLRAMHERAIQRLTKDAKVQHVEDAQFNLQATLENETNVSNRIAYYQGLIDGGLTGWEVTQQVTKHVATGFKIGQGLVELNAAIVYLIPQVGSPFAMKYGGKETGDSFSAWSQWTGTMASILDSVSASAALEATFQRRKQEWGQQLVTAQQEFRQLEQQRQAGETRVALAEKELEIHETTMDQTQEVYDFFKDKFTNLGLYNYLATTLTRLHREAYNVAHDLAALAERAYRFETDDDTTFIAPDNWQFDRVGLLAGERLVLQLQQLDSAFLRKNTRRYEMTQSFSLALVDPSALLKLRETGSCEFTLPEVLYDLVYPGQYKRLIKSVRLTIPSVAGPYTNVSAKLSLTQSKVRTVKSTDPSDLVTLPLQTTQSIATSTAQNDGGMFELSFRDERYLPFEGAGAVSTWSLEFPSQLRQFDYSTIADVIVTVAYTALDDDVFRATVETQLVDELTEYASTVGMYRLFSLRHDFPDAFQILLHPPGPSQLTDFTLGSPHFPYFLAQRDLTLGGVSVYVQPRGADPVDTTGLKLTINGASTSSWTTPPNMTLRTADAPVSGPALKGWTVKVTTGQLDPDEVADVLLLVKYTAA